MLQKEDSPAHGNYDQVQALSKNPFHFSFCYPDDIVKSYLDGHIDIVIDVTLNGSDVKYQAFIKAIKVPSMGPGSIASSGSQAKLKLGSRVPRFFEMPIWITRNKFPDIIDCVKVDSVCCFKVFDSRRHPYLGPALDYGALEGGGWGRHYPPIASWRPLNPVKKFLQDLYKIPDDAFDFSVDADVEDRLYADFCGVSVFLLSDAIWIRPLEGVDCQMKVVEELVGPVYDSREIARQNGVLQ